MGSEYRYFPRWHRRLFEFVCCRTKVLMTLKFWPDGSETVLIRGVGEVRLWAKESRDWNEDVWFAEKDDRRIGIGSSPENALKDLKEQLR